VRISIAERLRPFSHRPGTSFVLPGSALSLEIFPTLIRIFDLSEGMPDFKAEIILDLTGPIEGFTAVQDLENGSLRVFGESAQGYFRYIVKAVNEGKGITVTVEKAPTDAMLFTCVGRWDASTFLPVNAGETIVFPKSISLEEIKPCVITTSERLSLGNHKKQDWELVSRRLSFAEIFPLWHRLGQVVTKPASTELYGISLLLNHCKDIIAANTPDKLLPEFKKIFLVGFDGILSPRFLDTDYQGIDYPSVEISDIVQNKISALTLLTEGAKIIRSLFIQETENEIRLLPSLPPEFHCGRLTDTKCCKQGLLSLEWTKKSIRLVTFRALENQKLGFSFANHERKCRLRTSNKDKGIVYIPGTQIDIIAGQNYWFDNFER
jgi:hypothetical protein